MARGETPSSDLTREVAAAKNIPYSSSLRFVKGLVTGKYKLSNTNLNDLAWQTLLDPVPTFAERFLRRQYAGTLDDTSMIDAPPRGFSALKTI
jgi:hypothetical protein